MLSDLKIKRPIELDLGVMPSVAACIKAEIYNDVAYAVYINNKALLNEVKNAVRHEIRKIIGDEC